VEPDKTTACLRCGSIRARLVTGNPLQWVLAILFRQEVIACTRCGWRGRQSRLAADPRRRHGAKAVAVDEVKSVDLGALDHELDSMAPPVARKP
jgi:hypothetical protein